MGLLGWGARARRIGARELMFVARVGATATVASGMLKAAPLPWVARLTTLRGPVRMSVPPEPRIVALTDRLLAVDRGPLRPNCVLRSLVLLRYLPGDAPLVLKFGIRPGVRPVDGHAWIERDGRPFAERADPHAEYAVTWSWPS